MPLIAADRFQRGGSGTGPFPIMLEADGKLSYVTVADIATRDAIEEWRRMAFMRVHVISEDKDYRLGANVTIAGQVWTEISVGVDATTYQARSERNQPSGYVGLESNGKINPVYIDNIYTNNAHVTTSLVARNALVTLVGDVVTTTDTSQVFVKLNNNPPPCVDADFAELMFPGSVLSVNGLTGVVTITISSLLADSTNLTDFNTAVSSAPAVTDLDSQVVINTLAIANLQTDVAALQALTAVSIEEWDIATNYEEGNYVDVTDGSGNLRLFKALVNNVGLDPLTTPAGTWKEVVGDATNYMRTNVDSTLTGSRIITFTELEFASSGVGNFQINMYNGIITLASNNLFLAATTNASLQGENSIIALDSTGILVTIAAGDTFRYSTDRSADYTLRSIPDVEYVQGQDTAIQTYANTHLLTKTLPAVPTGAQHGQALRWNDSTTLWEYFTPSVDPALYWKTTDETVLTGDMWVQANALESVELFNLGSFYAHVGNGTTGTSSFNLAKGGDGATSLIGYDGLTFVAAYGPVEILSSGNYQIHLSTSDTGSVWAGGYHTITDVTVEYGFLAGYDLVISGSATSYARWPTMFGEASSITINQAGVVVHNAVIIGGYLNNITVNAAAGSVYASTIIGTRNTITNTTAASLTGATIIGYRSTNYADVSTVMGFRGHATAAAPGAFVHGFSTTYTTSGSWTGTVEPVTSGGRHAINISANSAAQTAGHGAYGDYSGIFAGQDHDIPSTSPRSVIIGGNAIKARASDPDNVYVPYLNITQIAEDTTSAYSQVIVRDSATGKLYWRDEADFGGGGGGGGGWSTSGDTTLDNVPITITGTDNIILKVVSGTTRDISIDFEPLGVLTLSALNPDTSAVASLTMTTERFTLLQNSQNGLMVGSDFGGILLQSVDFEVYINAQTNALKFNSGTLGVFGVTPIARPTTAFATATFVANSSGIINDTATFDGYTIGQIVKALRNLGLLT